MNIPARLLAPVYLGDIGISAAPMGRWISPAGSKAYLDGQWYTFDPRNKHFRGSAAS